MRLEETKHGNVVVFKVLQPRLAADVAGPFKEQIVQSIRDGNRSIVLDLQEVNFVDSSGLGAIVSCLKAIAGDGDLVICGTRNTVASLFKLTRMDKVFRMFDNTEQAIAALS